MPKPFRAFAAANDAEPALSAGRRKRPEAVSERCTERMDTGDQRRLKHCGTQQENVPRMLQNSRSALDRAGPLTGSRLPDTNELVFILIGRQRRVVIRIPPVLLAYRI